MSEVSMLVQIVEAALLAAGKPLSMGQIEGLFEEHERPGKEELNAAMAEVGERCEGRGYELIEVASGFRFQVREQLSPWVSRLWQERPQRYSRALLETLALIAYRQPITRGEIEEIRGVAVSSNIIKTLHEREWIRVVGHRDVPGRPAMYATTRQFLDYFNLKSLEQLPALADIRDVETLTAELGFTDAVAGESAESGAQEQAADAQESDAAVAPLPAVAGDAANEESTAEQVAAAETETEAEGDGAEDVAEESVDANLTSEDKAEDEEADGVNSNPAEEDDEPPVEPRSHGQG